MVVVTLTDFPSSLRGDLSKWLLEIQAGVFIGNVSARVRDSLWKRIREACKNGRAVMVYSATGEQRMNFRTLGDTWEPIDFDGIKLMLRPSPSRLKNITSNLKPGFSKAAARRTAKRMAAAQSRFPASYVVIDLETTGLDADKDEIIEIAALKVEEHEIRDDFSVLVRVDRALPSKIVEITGITDAILSEGGVNLSVALTGFLEFIGAMPMVSHNVGFDYEFLRGACARCGLPLFANRCVDTLPLAKRLVKEVSNYKLATLAGHFGIEQEAPHRSANDCRTTQMLYAKLIDLLERQ